MADGKIIIDTKIDETGAEKGLKSLSNKVKKTGKDIKKSFGETSKDFKKVETASKSLSTVFNEVGGEVSGFAGRMGSVAASGGIYAAAAVGVVEATKAIHRALTACNEAFKVQEKAERALAEAAKNNPYFTDEMVDGLKNFASQLQETSNIGDEYSISLMANLVAAGRTQQEIQDIMQVAADMEAAGIMSMESAVTNLSKSYSGLAGELGELMDDVRNLSVEQLKNGEAVEVLGEKYKGMALSTVDYATQAKNAFGDFTEQVGAIVNPFFDSMNQKMTEFWQELAEGTAEFGRALQDFGAGFALDENVKLALSYVRNEDGSEIEGVKLFNQEQLETAIRLLENKEKVTPIAGGIVEIKSTRSTEEEQALIFLKEELALRQRIATDEERQKRIEAEARSQEEERLRLLEEGRRVAQEEADEKQRLRDSYDETLRAKEAELESRRATGEQISQEAEAQEMLNTALSAYIRMMSDPVMKDETGSHRHEVDARKQISQWQDTALNGALDQEALEKAREFEKEMEGILAGLQEQAENKYQVLLRQLDEEFNAVVENERLAQEEKTRLTEEYTQVRAEIEQAAREEAERAEKEMLAKQGEASKAKTQQIVSDVSTYIGQLVSIVNDASDLMLQTIQNESDAELATLEKKYLQGELSEEEYQKAITETKRQAAKEQYKVQMVQWSASLLQAMANIALGVTQAMTEGFPMGLISGALVSAAGAVQIASIIASKPTPPSFSTGGIVGGSSYYGDNIAANLNSREMVMNMSQQKGLWDFINGGSKGGGQTNIVVNNNASNLVTAQPKINQGMIELMIDARVNESLQKGRYNQSLAMANQSQSGTFYGI